MTPRSYRDWRHCIEVQCGIPLTLDFVKERLSSLRDDRAYQTKRFEEVWGDAHRYQVIAWFEQAERELEKAV